MEKALNYQGLNGEDHRFSLADMSNPRALSQRGGVVVIVRNPAEPIYIADTASIRGLLADGGMWQMAQSDHGATGVYLLPSGNGDWCRAVANNLRARYTPVMNR